MGYKSKFKAAEIDARLEKMVNVTYAELKALRDGGNLIAGQMYRMTDYETTCTWEGTQCAGHPFDLVLTALGNKTLDEKCSAIWSARDTDGYFANSNLPAWDVRYCLDNDVERFKWFSLDGDEISWVDANGKGVIYRLTDEVENSVPYDFKNIMFSRPLTEGKYDEENGVRTFCYTFCNIDWDTFKITDKSVEEQEYCYCNIIGMHAFNNVCLVFGWDYCYGNTFGNDSTNNTFGGNCYGNTFGDYCYDNTFGNVSINNTFGDNCYDNTFGGYCYNNTFGGNCYGNTFGNDCDNNTFGDDCYNNTFGDYCYGNTFGDYCDNNTFGDDCYNNTFGDYCYGNTFGDNCYGNTFGDNCYDNTFGDYCYDNTFGGYCYENTLGTEDTASEWNCCESLHLSKVTGVQLQTYRGRNYDTYITQDKNGNTVEYTVDDIINK